MGPKRRGRRVVGTVRKTKKVVEETVEVSMVERAVGESQEDTVELDSLRPPTEERIKTTITVEKTKFPKSDEPPQVPVDQQQPPHNVGLGGEPKRATKVAKAADSSPIDRTDDDETQEPKKEKSPEPEQTVPEKKTKKKNSKVKENGGVKRKRRKKADEGNKDYKRYVFRVLKQVHPGMTISSQAMEVLNAYMNDMFGRLADEAAKLSRYTKKKTLSSREIQGVARLVLPGELGKHAVAEGAKAVANYMDYGASKI